MIIDCFIFYNEFQMLDLHLKELDPIVDYFVIVEADKTFTGKEKPLYFEEKKYDYLDYLDKIIHVIVKDMPDTETAWDREAHQRNCIQRGLDELNLKDEDIIILCDVDEITDTTLLKTLKQSQVTGLFALEQDFYYYNFNCQMNEKWYYAKFFNYGFLKQTGLKLQQMRTATMIQSGEKRFPVRGVKNGGWHLSYFGDTEYIMNKIKNFSHQEFNTEQFTDPKHIEEQITKCEDLFGRGNLIKRVEISEESYLPNNWKMMVKI